jgi:hypothetical protein
MKTGVETDPWGSVSVPARAEPSLAVTVKYPKLDVAILPARSPQFARSSEFVSSDDIGEDFWAPLWSMRILA